MPRRTLRSVLRNIVIVLLASGLIYGLAACGHVTGSEGSVSSTTGPTQGVAVEIGASSYGVADTIGVTVRNALPESIVAPDHQTSCTIVQLQLESNGAWQNHGGCAMGIATRRVSLAAGSSAAVKLAPGAGQISAKPWPAGTYRVAFTYQIGAPDTTNPSVTVYSQPFTVS